MPDRQDLTEARNCLRRARQNLGEAHRAVGMANLRPGADPGAIRSQIHDLERMVQEASEELAAAKTAFAHASRGALKLV